MTLKISSSQGPITLQVDTTTRLAITRTLARWLPRCPLCHRACRCEHGPDERAQPP
jgi:hypothetical protein